MIGHGQMHADELEEAMLKFVRREADILVATTIIESGLDIPNANTIFINEADNYGLADLHQLRGRVGRYKHRAYAYLLLDSERAITPTAARRLKAIEEFTELGAGFKIAMRDLEIRGAGNILGTQQSGHIAAVGYELYCQLLENAVRGLKNQPLRTPLEVTLDLPWPAVLPRDYVPGQKLKIEVYRRLARIRRPERLEDFRQELRDRFGPPPQAVEWLLRLAELRLLAARWHIASVHLEGPPEGGFGPTDLVLTYRSPRRMEKLSRESGGRLRVVDSESAYLRLAPSEILAFGRATGITSLPAPSERAFHRPPIREGDRLCRGVLACWLASCQAWPCSPSAVPPITARESTSGKTKFPRRKFIPRVYRVPSSRIRGRGIPSCHLPCRRKQPAWRRRNRRIPRSRCGRRA